MFRGAWHYPVNSLIDAAAEHGPGRLTVTATAELRRQVNNGDPAGTPEIDTCLALVTLAEQHRQLNTIE